MPFKDKDEHRKYCREWLQNRRYEWLRDKSCIDCGSLEKLWLWPLEPASLRTHALWSWREERRREELAKYTTVCESCYRTRLSNLRARHGTRSRFDKGCRCDFCKNSYRLARVMETVRRYQRDPDWARKKYQRHRASGQWRRWRENSQQRRVFTNPLCEVYPYAPKEIDCDLLKIVNDAVPRSVPEVVRADVCQDLILNVLAGEIPIAELGDNLESAIKRAWTDLRGRWGTRSLSDPAGDRRTFGEAIGVY